MLKRLDPFYEEGDENLPLWRRLFGLVMAWGAIGTCFFILGRFLGCL